jgi:hypothetical protein
MNGTDWPIPCLRIASATITLPTAANLKGSSGDFLQQIATKRTRTGLCRIGDEGVLYLTESRLTYANVRRAAYSLTTS